MLFYPNASFYLLFGEDPLLPKMPFWL